MAAEHDLFNKLFEISGTENKLDLDRIRKYIIGCIFALNELCRKDPDEAMKQHVSVNAVQLLVKEGKEGETNGVDADLLISQFKREKDKNCNTCNWWPLHWAIVLRDKIKEEVVHALFLASATCLTQHLDTAGKACPGFTPADLLVMQNNPNMSLVRFFDLRNPNSFKTSRFNIIFNQQVFPLHVAARYSENLELLQYLLQTHFAAVTACGTNNAAYQPLSYFILRADFPTFDSMLQCLLDASSDSEVIGLAIHQVLRVSGKQIGSSERILKLMKILLNANPAAAKHIFLGSTPFREVCHLMDPQCTLTVMKLLLIHNPLGLEVVDILGIGQNLPIHVALEHSTVEAVKFMLQVYPSSIESTADPGLMHAALLNIVDAGMVPYLCSIAPQLLHIPSGNKKPLAYLCDIGIRPGHEAALNRRYAKVLAMCNTDPAIVNDETTVGHELPLHILLKAKKADDSPTSDYADCLRLLLRLHPLSAGALDTAGDSPISIAIQKKMDDYFIRLPLSASTDAEHKAMLSEHIYKNRSCLLFLSFFAVSRCPQANIFTRLRQSRPEVIRVVASFL